VRCFVRENGLIKEQGFIVCVSRKCALSIIWHWDSASSIAPSVITVPFSWSLSWSKASPKSLINHLLCADTTWRDSNAPDACAAQVPGFRGVSFAANTARWPPTIDPHSTCALRLVVSACANTAALQHCRSRRRDVGCSPVSWRIRRAVLTTRR